MKFAVILGTFVLSN